MLSDVQDFLMQYAGKVTVRDNKNFNSEKEREREWLGERQIDRRKTGDRRTREREREWMRARENEWERERASYFMILYVILLCLYLQKLL